MNTTKRFQQMEESKATDVVFAKGFKVFTLLPDGKLLAGQEKWGFALDPRPGLVLEPAPSDTHTAITLCEYGIHYSRELYDALRYHSFGRMEMKMIWEVEDVGTSRDCHMDKTATSHLRLVKPFTGNVLFGFMAQIYTFKDGLYVALDGDTRVIYQDTRDGVLDPWGRRTASVPVLLHRYICRFHKQFNLANVDFVNYFDADCTKIALAVQVEGLPWKEILFFDNGTPNTVVLKDSRADALKMVNFSEDGQAVGVCKTHHQFQKSRGLFIATNSLHDGNPCIVHSNEAGQVLLEGWCPGTQPEGRPTKIEWNTDGFVTRAVLMYDETGQYSGGVSSFASYYTPANLVSAAARERARYKHWEPSEEALAFSKMTAEALNFTAADLLGTDTHEKTLAALAAAEKPCGDAEESKVD